MAQTLDGHKTDTHRHADGQDGQGTYTVRVLSALHGQKADSVMTRVRRRLGKGYGLDTPLSIEQAEELFGAVLSFTAAAIDPAPENQPITQPEPETQPAEPVATDTWSGRRLALYGLMAVPAIASIQNLYHVTHDLTGEWTSAMLLTGLFSASPFVFVLAGLRSNWTKGLTATLIVYEVFANFTRIYGGLMGAGKVAHTLHSGKIVATMTGNPTRFIGLITDIFPGGTHQTAIVMAAIMSSLAASVFYASYNELGK